MKALVVDDEVDIGMMVAKFLEKEGVETQVAQRCKTAKEIIETHDFDVFFLDIHLPDGVGFDLVPTIRKQHPDAKIAMISAYDDINESENFKAFKIGTFIKKPFSKKQIIAVIDQLR